MLVANPFHPGRHLRLDGCPFVVEKVDGDDIHLIQLARPGELVARGPWIYTRAQLEAFLDAEGV